MTTLLMLTMIVACFGFGHVVQRLLRFDLPWPHVGAIGLSILLFLGGLVNALNLAFEPTLNAILLVGILLAIFAVLKPGSGVPFHRGLFTKPKLKEFSLHSLPALLLISCIFALTAYAVGTNSAFNYHDDFEKYFIHPLRMLATGTMRGNPYDALGVETLGGMGFLHGFVAAHSSLRELSAVDLLFGRTLFLLQIWASARQRAVPPWALPLIVAAPVAVAPMINNISALYTACGLLFALFELRERIFEAGPAQRKWGRDRWRDITLGVLFGLVGAAMVSLKNTFVLPVAIFVLIYFTAKLVKKDRRAACYWAAGMISAFALALAPWIILHAGDWLQSIETVVQPSLQKTSSYFPMADLKHFEFFSVEELFYGHGSTSLHYTLLILVGIFGVIFAVWSDRDEYSFMDAVAAMVVPIVSVLWLVLLMPFISTPDQMLRLLVPILLFGIPVSLLCIAGRVHATRYHHYGFLVVAALILGSFSYVWVNRIEQSLKEGTYYAFAYKSYKENKDKIESFMKYALSPENNEYWRNIQAKVPEQAKVLVWTMQPFNLDYSRNALWNTNPAGLAFPYTSLPIGHGPDALLGYLKEKGVRFVIWQYAGGARRGPLYYFNHATLPGLAVREMYLRAYAFSSDLGELALSPEVRRIFKDRRTVILDLGTK